MTNNPIQEIYNNSKKIYKTVTNKEFLKWFYISFLCGLLIFITFIITGLLVDINPNGVIILFVGAGVGIISLISFYIVEYLRRKALNFYKSQFNFAYLYSNFLYAEKIVNTQLQLDVDFDNSFFRQQLEVCSRQYEFANLHKNYATYKFFMNEKAYHISYCNASIVSKNSKIFNGNNKIFHLIIATNYTSNLEGIITLKNNYNVNQIDIWMKQQYGELDIYTNNELKDWEPITKLFNDLIKNNLKLIEIKVKANKIFIVFDFSESCLLIGLSNIKFYKLTWKEIIDKYWIEQTKVKNIFKAIQTLQ